MVSCHWSSSTCRPVVGPSMLPLISFFKPLSFKVLPLRIALPLRVPLACCETSWKESRSFPCSRDPRARLFLLSRSSSENLLVVDLGAWFYFLSDLLLGSCRVSLEDEPRFHRRSLTLHRQCRPLSDSRILRFPRTLTSILLVITLSFPSYEWSPLPRFSVSL